MIRGEYEYLGFEEKFDEKIDMKIEWKFLAVLAEAAMSAGEPNAKNHSEWRRRRHLWLVRQRKT